MADQPKPSILLIDDKADLLDGLKRSLQRELASASVEIKIWQPKNSDDDPLTKFNSLVGPETVLVVTDYDLTSGLRGLFGITIVGWCQQRSIPVGDFSRGNRSELPKEPNLFELRVPPNDADAAQFIGRTWSGFQSIRQKLDTNASFVSSKRSLAAVLAAVLDKAQSENQFALYMSRLGAANSSLLDTLKATAGPSAPSADDKKRLLTYVLGHVLLNAILKYPGPILSEKALCAYLAASDDEASAVADLFEKAAYRGPFSRKVRYFWRDEVDKKIDELGTGFDDEKFEMFSDLNRAAVERALNRKLKNHDCSRCEGTKGGFFVPVYATSSLHSRKLFRLCKQLDSAGSTALPCRERFL
jgi:hypothetical protein